MTALHGSQSHFYHHHIHNHHHNHGTNMMNNSTSLKNEITHRRYSYCHHGAGNSTNLLKLPSTMVVEYNNSNTSTMLVVNGNEKDVQKMDLCQDNDHDDEHDSIDYSYCPSSSSSSSLDDDDETCSIQISASVRSTLSTSDDDDNDDASLTLSALGTRKSRRFVHFAAMVDITEIPNYQDGLTIEERNAIWITSQEMEETLMEYELTASILHDPSSSEHNHLIDDIQLCARGIDDTLTNMTLRAESTCFVRQMVLSQYAFLISTKSSSSSSTSSSINCNNDNDNDVTAMVAKVYSDCVKPAVKKAYDQGLQDEQDAKRIQNNV